MDIVFKTTGATTRLKKWLQSLKDIDESLILEIDLESSNFMCKSFTPDKTIVRYTRISFADCNLEVTDVIVDGKTVTVDEWLSQNPGKRVYVGILDKLTNFIDMVAYFNERGEHKIIIRFKEVDGRFQTHKVDFKSHIVNMTYIADNLCEFELKLLDDNVFYNVIAAIQQPVSFMVNSDVAPTINKGFAIFSKDIKKDIVSFDIVKVDDKWTFIAKDYTRQQIDVNIADEIMSGEENVAEATSPVTLANFQNGVKGHTSDKYIMTVSTASGAKNEKLIIKEEDGSTVTAIANVRV